MDAFSNKVLVQNLDVFLAKTTGTPFLSCDKSVHYLADSKDFLFSKAVCIFFLL